MATTTEARDIRAVRTGHGELRYYRDWDMDGAVCMINPRTIARYMELLNRHPDADEYGVWFAFTDARFQAGYARMREAGKIKEGDRVCRDGSLFGTEAAILAFYAAYDRRREMMAAECDPQEVYFFEYNNHECMFGWDGDKDALDAVERIFGKDALKGITRIN